MSNILLYISTGFILFAYLGYFLFILFGRNKKVSNSSGFDVTKDIISEYNSINVIESKSYFTMYNIKRRVIKLSMGNYYGKDLSSISLSLLEAVISVIDDKKNIYIDYIRKIFSNLKILYIFPLIAILINNLSFNVSDAKASIFFLVIFTFISYILVNIKIQASCWIRENLKKISGISKDNRLKIDNFIDRLVFFDKIIFFGEVIIIIRLMLIFFDII